jgi:hypothetical protein
MENFAMGGVDPANTVKMDTSNPVGPGTKNMGMPPSTIRKLYAPIGLHRADIREAPGRKLKKPPAEKPFHSVGGFLVMSSCV